MEECSSVVKSSFEPQTAICVVLKVRGQSTASNTVAEQNAQAKHTWAPWVSVNAPNHCSCDSVLYTGG